MAEQPDPPQSVLTLFLRAKMRPLRRVVVLIAELSALAGAGAFLISTLIGSFIFSRWGLTYLQLATPSDIVVGGLHLVTTTIGLLLVYVIGFFAGIIVGENKIRMAICVIAVAVFWIMFLYYAQNGQTIIPNNVAVLFMLISIGFVSYYIAGANPRNTILAISITAIFISVGAVTKLSLVGYFEQAEWVAPDNRTCRVMWLGSQNMVVRCAGVISVEHREQFSIGTAGMVQEVEP